MAQWRLLRCRAMLAQARGRYADAYRLGAQAFGTLAATGFPPAFLLWGGLLSIQCHHTGQTTEALGLSGITDADATAQDWPLAGVIPTLAPASMLADAGRLREAAAVYRRLGPASEWQESPHATLFTWAFGIATALAVGADDDVATLRAKLGAWRGHHVVNGRYAMAYGGPGRALSRSRGRAPRARRRCDRRSRAGGEGLHGERSGGLPRRGRVRARLGTGPSLGAG